MTALLLAFAIAATGATSYDCRADRAVTIDGRSLSLQEAGLRSSEASFKLGIGESDGTPVIDIDWPGDPVRLQGKHFAHSSREGSAFLFSSAYLDPCKAAEDGCETLVSLTPAVDGSVAIQILPRMIPTNKFHEPFSAPISGKCTPSGKTS